MKGKNVLVTGAAGFIGSHITEELIKTGANVIGLDNLYTGTLDNLRDFMTNPRFQFVNADIRDKKKMDEITKDIDIIFHEAAQTSVPESVEKPLFCNDVNINGTMNILDSARKNDVKKVVFASSAAIYGSDPILPKKEDMHVQPISPYGVAKLAAESYMVAFKEVYGLNTTSLRYFNVYGPRQKNSPYSGVLSIFANKILENKNPVIMGDGKQTRDYIYVKDIVKANILAAKSEFSAGRVYNVATGITTDLTTVTKMLIKSFNKNNIDIEYNSPRSGDIKFSSADTSRIKKELGFIPEYTIETGIAAYTDFLKNN